MNRNNSNEEHAMQEMELVEISVGKPYPIPHKFELNSNLNLFEIGALGANLFIGYPNLTDLELHAVKKGNFKFSVADVDGVGFFISEIVDYPKVIGVSDCAFHASLLVNNISELPNPIDYTDSLKNNELIGIPLNIYLIETTTLIIRSIRTVTLSTTFSKKLATLLHKQYNDPITESDYLSNVKKVQAKYTAKDFYKIPHFSYERKVF